MQTFFKEIADSKWFQNFIIAVILFAGVVVGCETYRDFAEQHAYILSLLNNIVLWIFVAEIAIRMGAHGRKFWRYFFDSWNVFDFLIVMVCFLPLNTQHIVVLRLLRLLRVLKLVRALPRLQVLVGAMFKSISSIIYVSILLFLLFYLYGVAGTFIFGNNDPVHFRNLQTSILSLFRACTLEDWTDLMYINMYGSDVYGYDATMLAKWKPQSKAMPVLGAIYFVSFVMIATMILLNLFVGVIINSMDEAMKDAKDAELIQLRGKNTLQEEIAELSRQMEALHNQMERILRKVKKDASL